MRFPLKLKGVVYLQVKAELDCEAKSFSPCSNKNFCWILAGQLGCVQPCLVLTPFRTCGGVGPVSLLTITLGSYWGFFLFPFSSLVNSTLHPLIIPLALAEFLLGVAQTWEQGKTECRSFGRALRCAASALAAGQWAAPLAVLQAAVVLPEQPILLGVNMWVLVPEACLSPSISVCLPWIIIVHPNGTV